MKRLGRNDSHDRAPRQLYIAGKFRLQFQLVFIGFHDGAAQAISIFESDLIGKCVTGEEGQNDHQKYISRQSNSPCGTKLDGPGWADKSRASKNAVLLYLTGRSNRTNSTESADGTFLWVASDILCRFTPAKLAINIARLSVVTTERMGSC